MQIENYNSLTPLRWQQDHNIIKNKIIKKSKGTKHKNYEFNYKNSLICMLPSGLKASISTESNLHLKLSNRKNKYEP